MAVFSSLADKLQETFKKLTGKGKLTEADIDWEDDLDDVLNDSNETKV